MHKIFSNPNESLSAKLIIAIGVLMLFGSLIFWYAIFIKQEKDVLSIAGKYGDSFVKFTKDSTRYSMLASSCQETQQSLENLSTPEGVERVRIFAHRGRIAFSSDRKDIGRIVDKTSIACNGCHTDVKKSSELRLKPIKKEFYKDQKGYTALKLVEPIYNELACYAADCHIHTDEPKILGFYEADLSLALLDQAKFKQGLALTAYVLIFILVISIALGFILWVIVKKPIEELSTAMETVAAGNLDHSMPVRTRDEMGVLAERFNSMISDLKAARDQREKWTQTLEAEIAKKTEQIKKTHTNMLQTEKLASLGRMSAGVAHEINNPLTGIVTFAHLMKKDAKPGSSEAADLDVIIEQAERCAKIIKNLLVFSRATPSGKGHVSINEVLSRSLYMVKNQEKFYNIKFDVKMDDSQLTTTGDPSQFQQIFLNMLINAADAMNERGTITIVTRKVTDDDKPYVEIEFTDTGCGIKEEDMPKLFEPFFTTKPVDKGTGLGLSVTHGIVKHYGGQIKVESTVGKGASFFVRLPIEEQTV